MSWSAAPAPEVLVLGAGVAGLVCAVHLAECGAQVTLVEAAGAIGAGASWRAGGMLAPWCESENAPPAILEAAEDTIGWWLAHAPGAVRAGSLVLAPARDAGELRQFARRTSGHRWLDQAAIGELEPDLGGRFSQGLFFPREAHLDPREALAALAVLLQARGGRLVLGAEAAAEAAAEAWPAAGGQRGRSRRVVDCRGLAARDRLDRLRGVRGEMLLLHCPEIRLGRPVRLLHPRAPVYLVPRSDGRFMLGATMVESERRGGITARAAMELLGAAYALHPAFAEAEILETGAGLRPSFPDNMPKIVEQDGVILVNGMYRHGFLMAPVLSAEVARRLGLPAPDRVHR